MGAGGELAAQLGQIPGEGILPGCFPGQLSLLPGDTLAGSPKLPLQLIQPGQCGGWRLAGGGAGQLGRQGRVGPQQLLWLRGRWKSQGSPAAGEGQAGQGGGDDGWRAGRGKENLGSGGSQACQGTAQHQQVATNRS